MDIFWHIMLFLLLMLVSVGFGALAVDMFKDRHGGMYMLYLLLSALYTLICVAAFVASFQSFTWEFTNTTTYTYTEYR